MATKDVIHRVGDLDIDENMDYQIRLWRFRFWGRVVGVLFIFLGLAGVFGHGPYSHRVVKENTDVFSVHYEKFGNYGSPSEIRIDFSEKAGHEGEISVWIDSESLKNVKLKSIFPQPHGTSFGPTRTIFTYKVQQHAELAGVVFEIEPETFGEHHVNLGLVNGPEIQFSQFFWP